MTRNRRTEVSQLLFSGAKPAAEEIDLSTEDFNSFKNKVSNMLSIFESDSRAAKATAKSVLSDIGRFRNVVKTKQGVRRTDAPDIKLRSYAKWLSLDGRVVTDADRILHEVNRLCEAAKLFETVWYDQYGNILRYARDIVDDNEPDDVRGLQQAIAATFTGRYPRGFDRLLTKTETLKDPYHGKKLPTKVSDWYLGHWRIADVGISWANEKDRFPSMVREKSSVDSVELHVLDLDTMKKLMDGLEQACQSLQCINYVDIERTMYRLYSSVALVDADEEEEDEDQGFRESWFAEEAEEYVENLINLYTNNKAADYLSSTITVLLKWIDQSLKRMD